MTRWVAVAYGALDISDWYENKTDIELVLLSTLPSEPMGLTSEPAALWRLLIELGPIEDARLTGAQRQLIREFADAGIASSEPSHPARMTSVPRPWLSSPIHELIYSLVASVARDNQIDAVFIKGPTLSRQGLRNREHSGDVDVWVDPQKIELLAGELLDWGWGQLPNSWGDFTAYHSLTLVPGSWGCELDLHRHMPGCALPDTRAFEVIYEQVMESGFAGVNVFVPQPTAHAVVAALHLTRPHGQPAPDFKVGEAAQSLRQVGVGALSFAIELGATAALESVLRHAFPNSVVEADHPVPLNWRWRAESRPLRRTLLYIRSVPIIRWPEFFRRLLWPHAQVVWKSDELHERKSANLFMARANRLKYGISASLSRKRK